MKKIRNSYAVVYADSSNASFRAGEMLREGLVHHQAGRLGEAARLYEGVIALSPNNPDALNLLGVIALANGEVDYSVSLSRRATAAAPNHAGAFSNLGNSLLAQGALQDSRAAFERSIKLQFSNADVHYNLANLLRQMDEFDLALKEYQAAVALNPNLANAYMNRANLLAHLSRHEEAIDSYNKALELVPNAQSAHSNLSASFAALKNYDQAEHHARIAVTLNPQDPKAKNNLGSVLLHQGKAYAAIAPLREAVRLVPTDIVCRNNLVRALLDQDADEARNLLDETLSLNPDYAATWWLLGILELKAEEIYAAADAFDRALELDPELIRESNNPGLAYNKCCRLDDAISFYDKVLSIRPDDSEAWADVAISHMNTGDVRRSLECLRTSLAINPHEEFAHSNMLMIQCYSPDFTAEELFQEARAWADLHAPVERQLPPVCRERQGKLRIGYVSPDFHDHPAGRIYEALFPYHDREKFDITIYANLVTADEVTRRIVKHSDRWRLVKQLSDDALAEQIRQDEIDILIDLVGHTPNHRLKVFGLRPAPVQMTWLGYFATTGMPQMDYILADRIVLPEKLEPYFTERPAIMPGTFYVYQPPDFNVEVTPLPALKNGHITFGCFNNTAKITPEVVALWAKVMKAVPGSKMLLNRWPFRSETARRHYLDLFTSYGIDPSRIELRATMSREPYYRSYQEVDLMLDSFPFGGSTTTTEALWMGVPVVTISSDRFCSRMSESVIRTVGLDVLPVADEDAYIRQALELVGDLPRLSQLRSFLREMTERSPLCDFKSYALDLETTYRWMWENRNQSI